MGELAFSAKMELRRARNELALAQADEAARGALVRAKAVLALDQRIGGELDGLGDVWNAPRERRYTIGAAEVRVEIVDENRKFNVYQLTGGAPEDKGRARARLASVIVAARAQSSRPISSSEALRMAEATEQYLHRRTANQGACAKLPRTKMNRVLGPFELCGPAFRPALFYDERLPEETLPGLERYRTTWGNAQGNLNTVEEQVLRAYFPGEESLALRLLKGREEFRPLLRTADSAVRPPTAKYQGHTAVENLAKEQRLPAASYASVAHFFTLRSNYFSVSASASVQGFTRTRRAVFLRTKEATRFRRAGPRVLSAGIPVAGPTRSSEITGRGDLLRPSGGPFSIRREVPFQSAVSNVRSPNARGHQRTFSPRPAPRGRGEAEGGGSAAADRRPTGRRRRAPPRGGRVSAARGGSRYQIQKTSPSPQGLCSPSSLPQSAVPPSGMVRRTRKKSVILPADSLCSCRGCSLPLLILSRKVGEVEARPWPLTQKNEPR